MTDTVTAFDLETTGLDLKQDYIIQIGIVKFNSKTFEELESKCWYIKPPRPITINPEAQEKHGISIEYLNEHGVLLVDVWDEIKSIIGDDDILSYNGNHFDVPMLYYNLTRENLQFDFSNRKYYDSMVIERKKLQYKLSETYKRYTGNYFDGAHDALCDVKATIEIFKHQISEQPESLDYKDFLLVSPEGLVKYNDNGSLIFTYGKYRNKLTNEICRNDPNYIKWVVEKFSNPTRIAIREEWYKENSKQKIES